MRPSRAVAGRAARAPPQLFGSGRVACPHLPTARRARRSCVPWVIMPRREVPTGDGSWQPVEIKPVLCLTGGYSSLPIPLVETREVPTDQGRKLFVHFAMYLPWVFQVVSGAKLRTGCPTGRKFHATGKLHGKVWEDLVKLSRAKRRGEGAAVAAPGEDDDDDEEPDDPMNGLLRAAPVQPDDSKAKKGSAKKETLLGKAFFVTVKDKCPFAFPADTETRDVKLISLKKNEYWICVDDLGWLLERLKSENELAGVPLVENPDEDVAAVAAPVQEPDSQDSQSSSLVVDSPERSAQGTVDNGYKCQWEFPCKEHGGRWEATITRDCEHKGKKVTCALQDFTKQKWNSVYGHGNNEPCKYGRATPAQRKHACLLYLEQHLAGILNT